MEQQIETSQPLIKRNPELNGVVKVLIIDDNPLFTRQAKIISSFGAEVQVITSSDQLTQLEQQGVIEQYEIIFLDQSISGNAGKKSGVTIAEMIFQRASVKSCLYWISENIAIAPAGFKVLNKEDVPNVVRNYISL